VRLSVALATHDGRRWLPELLDSLATQTRLPDELVVCDDASTDGTPAVLDDFAATAPFTVRRVDHDVRRGPVRAFETALGAVDGELIALCDQDDRWDREKLAVLEALVATPGTTLGFTDARMVDEGGAADGHRLWGELGFGRRQRDSLVSGPPGPMLRHAVASGCTMLVRRSVLDLALPFPAALDLVAGPMLHDRWLSLLAACSGKVAVVPATLVDYRVHDGQATGARWAGLREELGPQARRRATDVAARAEARLRQLDALEDRLAEPTAGVEQQLADLRDHLRVRAGLGPRPGRVLPVLGEVLSGGYRRFGAGAGSAVLDLLRR
jgi:hypothetical protein